MTVLDGEKRGICIVCGRRIPKRTTYRTFRNTDADAPRSKADCQALTNEKVIRVRYWQDGHVSEFTSWDGESYVSRYFCTNRCAMDQGYAAAQHGHRFVWKSRS